jgi:hypothetical protein
VNEVVTWHNRLGTYQIVRRRNVRLVAMVDNVAFARHHLVEPKSNKNLFGRICFVRMKFWNFKDGWDFNIINLRKKGATTFYRTALSRMTFITITLDRKLTEHSIHCDSKFWWVLLGRVLLYWMPWHQTSCLSNILKDWITLMILVHWFQSQWATIWHSLHSGIKDYIKGQMST